MSSWIPPVIFGYCSADTSDAPLPIFEQAAIELQAQRPTHEWVLIQQKDRLSLTRPDGVNLCIDMTAGKTRHRTGEAGHGAKVLASALGVNSYRKRYGCLPTVTDATGGLGQDAWAIASLGCQVTVMEQHPVIHALLANALTRALADSSTMDTARRIRLLSGKAEQLLQNHAAAVIYLDPMYPARSRKKADSRKGMQFLHAMLGPPEPDASVALLRKALSCRADRVVVKRPKGAALLESSSEFEGQRTVIESPKTRFDVYHSGRLLNP